MAGFIIRRLLWMLPLLLGVSIICFAMLKRAPGDPVAAMLAESRSTGQNLTLADRERLRHQLGLDRPAYLQYVDWLGQVAHGNLGMSTRMNQPVADVIMQRLPNTMKLAGVALVLTLVIALPLGVLSAIRQYSLLDYFLTTFNFIGISIPQFWLGLMLLYFFGVTLGWFPVRGMSSPYVEPGFWNQAKDTVLHYALPVASITLVSLAGYTRYQRAAMLEVIRQDYIRTARAKGLRERAVILGHAWRNSLIPIITLLGYVLVILVEGSIVVENIFSWPGMGQLAAQSLSQRDYPVVMAIVLLSATLILVGTLISDILYAIVDPRVRYD
ncbi:ABC transporter permease [Sphaerobacter sp.]|uniref:ABC transporter permease n=1 Tax=Sphaerobacter sp. TaxID=2099654 RepID=UPI001D4C3BB4|nr:ABC transporter permease [Sphaerobacter sp.]MBX5446641.1 ABC transporter permease [Sphaerobacter sp.]